VTLRSRLGPLEERDFRLLFLGRTVSMLGSAFAPVALAFAVIDDLDGSASQLGFVLSAIWVPQIAFILVGGIWGDRLPRQHVLVGTDLVMAATQGIVAALLLSGTAEIWHLAALQVVRGVAQAFFFPASTGLVPQVITERRLLQANALLRLSHSGVTIVGAAAGGIAVAAVGAGWALAFDAATFLCSAAFLVRIRIPAVARTAGSTMLRELREGWHEFRARTWLWAIVVQFMFINGFAVGAFLVLGPIVAKESLGGADAWGVILACQSVGLVAGGLIVLRARPNRLLLVASLAIFLMAPVYVLLAEAAPVAVIAAGALAAGVGIEVFGVLWDTSLQQQIPRDRLSRVSSYDALGSFVCIPIGLSIAGPIADAIGVDATLFLAAGVIVVATVLVLLVEDVRTLRRTAVEPADAAAI
jgi:predicted MFS family arabinose efflux permease